METVSVVVPVMDEQDTVITLAERVAEAFNSPDIGATLKEIIFVDDGSRDDTWNQIVLASQHTPVVSGIKFRRNFGKAAALQQGVLQASGEIIITMDGDLQDDPKEIPRFLAAIRSGLDVVSGWKKIRHDPLNKTSFSRVFNFVTARVSGVRIHDFNCGFKAYRSEVFRSVNLYGELHRFIPALAAAVGYRIGELEVEHHPRRFGKSKYGFGRLAKGLIDLLTVVTITRFNSRPGHLFGGLGLLVGTAGMGINLYLAALWTMGEPIGHRPLLSLGVLLTITGLQFVFFGMMAELLLSSQSRGLSAGIVAATTPLPSPARTSGA